MMKSTTQRIYCISGFEDLEFKSEVIGSFTRRTSLYENKNKLYQCGSNQEFYRISQNRSDYCYFTHICSGLDLSRINMGPSEYIHYDMATHRLRSLIFGPEKRVRFSHMKVQVQHLLIHSCKNLILILKTRETISHDIMIIFKDKRIVPG